MTPRYVVTFSIPNVTSRRRYTSSARTAVLARQEVEAHLALHYKGARIESIRPYSAGKDGKRPPTLRLRSLALNPTPSDGA